MANSRQAVGRGFDPAVGFCATRNFPPAAASPAARFGLARKSPACRDVRYLLDRQCSIIKSTTIKIYGEKYEKEIQHVA